MSARRRVLMPLPDRDFDVTEVSVPYHLLTAAGHEVVFATEHGGGHAPRMRQYLGSAALQGKVLASWKLGRVVAAICHGVLVLARTRDPETGESVIADSQTTCLPKYMERTAYLLTAWRLGDYYRTYPDCVEDEVKASLRDPARQFVRGPITLVRRGTMADDGPAMVVEDGRYLSARWPGDAYLLAKKLITRL